MDPKLKYRVLEHLDRADRPEAIRATMAALGIKYQAVSEMTGLKYIKVARVLTGHRPASDEDLDAIERALLSLC